MRLVFVFVLLVSFAASASHGAEARGDANADNVVDTADVFFLVSFLFGGGVAPLRTCLADADANQVLSITDVFYLVNYLFAAGTAPPAQQIEVCNSADDDCDGQIDDGVGSTFYRDADNDSYGSALDFQQACAAPSGYVGQSGDCADDNPLVFPGAAELCNNTDDDCDGTLDNGAASASCPVRPNTNTPACTAGNCAYACNFGYANCDGDFTTGCEFSIGSSSSCSISTSLGSISGDTGMNVVSRNGIGAQWFTLRITEDSISDITLSAGIHLAMPAGIDYDLYVYCFSCSGGQAAVSALKTGVSERVILGRLDSGSADASHNVLIEVRYYGGSSCSPWTLTATGNVAVFPDPTCGPFF